MNAPRVSDEEVDNALIEHEHVPDGAGWSAGSPGYLDLARDLRDCRARLAEREAACAALVKAIREATSGTTSIAYDILTRAAKDAAAAAQAWGARVRAEERERTFDACYAICVAFLDELRTGTSAANSTQIAYEIACRIRALAAGPAPGDGGTT